MEFLICLYFIMFIVVTLTEIWFIDDSKQYWTPDYFYFNKGMNWFGAYIVTIIIGLFSPILFVYKIFKWFLTVGRKK